MDHRYLPQITVQNRGRDTLLPAISSPPAHPLTVCALAALPGLTIARYEALKTNLRNAVMSAAAGGPIPKVSTRVWSPLIMAWDISGPNALFAYQAPFEVDRKLQSVGLGSMSCAELSAILKPLYREILSPGARQVMSMGPLQRTGASPRIAQQAPRRQMVAATARRPQNLNELESINLEIEKMERRR